MKDFAKSIYVGNANKAEIIEKKKKEGAKTGNAFDFETRMVVEKKEELKTAEDELRKAEADRNRHKGENYWEEAYITAKKDVERAKENLARAQRNKTGNKTGNDKTGAEEFFKKLSEDVKEREEKDDKEIKLVGNETYQHKLYPDKYVIIEGNNYKIITDGKVEKTGVLTDAVLYGINQTYKRVGNASVSGGTFKSDDGSQKAVIDVNPQSGTARVVWFENDRQNGSSDYRSIDLATAAVKRKGLKKVGNFKTGTSQLKPGDKVMSFGKKGTVKEVIGENTDNIYGEPLIKVEFEDGTTKTIGEHYMRKVGNRTISKESEMSQELKNLLKQANPEWKDKVSFAFSHGFDIDENDFINAIKKDLQNKRTGNARYTTKEDVISHLDTDLYDICKKVPSGSPSFAYISELQKKGWDMNTISKYSKEIGKIIDRYKVGNSKVKKTLFKSLATPTTWTPGINGRPISEAPEFKGTFAKDDAEKWTDKWIKDHGFEVENKTGNSAYDDGAKKGKEDKRKGKLITAAGFEYHAPGYSSLSFKEKEEYKKGYYSTNDLKKEDIYKWGNSAQDDKFAYVMREFDAGKLKTPDGKVVTDPAQAKAIAYSESKKTENGLARARNAMNKKCGNSQVTLWKGNDSVLISEDGTVQYLESNSFETDRDKYGSMQEAIDDLTKKGYRKK